MYDVKVHNSGRGKKEWKNDMYDKRNSFTDRVMKTKGN